MNKLRVHVVIQTGTAGGAEQMLMELLDEAAPRLDLTFEMLAHGPLVDDLWRFGPVSVVPTGSSALALARSARVLARRWRTLDADVVLANGVKAAAVAVPAGRIAGIRVVWLKHDFSFDRVLAPLLARAADGVVATSRQVAAAAGRDDAIVVTPPRPEAPLERAGARAELEELGLPRTEALVAATVGRLVRYKGVDDLIEAISLPAARDWHLAVVGDDDPTEPGERRRLERLAAERGVGSRVTFLGAVPGAGRLLAGVDAVAIATKTDGRFGREGFGLVAAEAMAAGVPLIATPGPPAERLDGAGVVVSAGSPEELSAALARLSDPAVREEMGGRGRRIVAAEADRSTRAAELVAALASVAGRPGVGLSAAIPVSVVTTVLNEGPAVDQLLDAIQAELGLGDELVVVDGGSSDDTAERVRRRTRDDPRVRLVEAPGTTIAAGRNVGVRAARHELIACTDAGCAPWPSWLDSLRAAFAERLQPDLVTGVYEVSAQTAFERAMAAACYPAVFEARRPRPLARLYGSVFGTAFVASMPTGRSLAFRRVAWERVGGFREQLATAEDVTFGRAVAEGGRCWLALDAGVTWRQRAEALETARMYFGYGIGGVRSRDLRLVARDVVRAGAYAVAPLALARGRPRIRRLLLAGATVYVSVPLLRARRQRRPLAVGALVPPALALKDVSKAAGMVAGALGLIRGRNGRGT